ncbi:MAG: 30S ribosomal protein S6e [Candidatus Aenigmarchaeota archaeon]|nr:30S ribosomal protein S6e [Candidatus Aenigmarchaeota archaeon]
MANFKFVVSSGSKSWQIEKDQKECPVMGKKIGDTFPGDFLGLPGYELLISGGSDKDGFPMRTDFDGPVRKRIVVTEGKGFRTDVKGLRRRKTLRGNTIGQDTVQVNCTVSKTGEKPLEEILGKKESKKEGEAEGKTETPKEEKVESKHESV